MTAPLNKTYTAEEIYKINADAVFEIDMFAGSMKYVGTGFFISQNGVAMTAYHVIDYSSKGNIILNDGTKLGLEEIYYIDKERDIAIFQVENPDGKKFTHLKINTNDIADGYNKIFNIGYIQKSPGYLNEGTILHKIYYQETQTYDMVATSLTTYAGDSGSPVLNIKNQVIGIVIGESKTKSYNLTMTLTSIDSIIKTIT
jgi:serine protease Do